MQYTVMNLDEIKGVMTQYGVDDVISFKVLSGGSQNTNYLVVANSDSYVLTVCEQKTMQETMQLALLLEHFSETGFLTSKTIRNLANEAVGIYDDKPIHLKTFLAGDIIPDLSNRLIELIGVQMGKLHKVEAPDFLPQKLSYGIEHFEEVADYAANSDFYYWLKEAGKQITPHLTTAIPKALIHSDIFYSNVIVDKEAASVTIMDFEEATYYYRIFDVGMAIVGLCKEEEAVDLEKVSALLKGYIQEIELNQAEQKALQAFTRYAATAMCFWRHKNFNYTNPIPAMADHYLELRNIANHIESLPQDCFLQLLNKGRV